MAVVKCAIELGIADAIENNEGPMTLSELSSSLGCAPSSLYRIMRFLVHHSIFKEKPSSQGTTVYVQTALSRRLLKKGEKSMVGLLLFESSHVMMAPWHNLSSRVLNDNNSPFEGAHGDDIWKYALANPAHSKLIDDAMACDAKLVVPEIVEGCPEVFDGVKTLVDVGGGNGTTLQMLVKAFPCIQGINFDLPHVVSAAPESEGVQHVGGDFFQSVPKADAAFLMWVLHDWNDEECIQILKNCKEAIQSDKGKCNLSLLLPLDLHSDLRINNYEVNLYFSKAQYSNDASTCTLPCIVRMAAGYCMLFNVFYVQNQSSTSACSISSSGKTLYTWQDS
ncbi:hypothetical protein D5086_018676 [Populus alba]|uniref:Uncharacterized protein n=1 Tax=Populus alba TaxID=43335 RepID=A0ACC4BR12_POPAL